MVTLIEEFVFFRSLLLLNQKRHPINCSSSFIGLNSPLVVFTAFSLIVHPAALSSAAWLRACCTLKHSSFGFGAVNSCCLLGLRHPAFRGPDSSWDCRRVLHRIPPNEIDQHGPTDLGWHSSRCSQPCKCFSSAISQAMHVF